MTVRIALGIAAIGLLSGCGSLLTPQYGIQEGRLGPCEHLRGCVSSQSTDPAFRIDPIAYTGDRAAARERLLSVIHGFRDAYIVSMHPTYIRVEFPSREAGTRSPNVLATDIAEFYFPGQAQHIEVRSLPRRNMPDRGGNRERIEIIRARFADPQ